MEVTVAKQKRKDQLTQNTTKHHKMKLMMVPVTVWILTDRVNVANLKMLLVRMDLDVLTILLVNILWSALVTSAWTY